MTDAELEAERAALLAEEHALLEVHQRLHLTPDDISGRRTDLERLKAHRNRIRVFREALEKRSTQGSKLPKPALKTDALPTEDAAPFPTCPVCQSQAAVTADRS